MIHPPPHRTVFVRLGLALWAMPLLTPLPAPASDRHVLSAPWQYIATDGQPEYARFHAHPIAGPEFNLRFDAHASDKESTLLLRQSDVKESWSVLLNGKRLGRLTANESPLQLALPVPPGRLRSGSNALTLTPPGNQDTIRIGEVVLDSRPMPTATGGAWVDVSVVDADLGTALPVRLTVVDQEGCLTPLRAGPDPPLAVRTGVAYAGHGQALLELQPGRYTVHATRGFEYGLATAQIDLKPGERRSVRLGLRREVDTSGWISCDTHTHTLTHSGHGDASVEERVLTLAGEGIEFPIATDHNTLANYDPAARQLGVRSYFTPVIGDEVTTRQAHFNVFPILEDSRLPDFRIGAWPALLENIRATPGVRVVILNHPHNIHNEFRPFDRQYFNPATGHPRAILDLHVDALEILSSSAQQSDPFLVVHDWFALLNGGHRLVGLGSSDVHDVNRYIVGQGRTYIRVDDSDPGNIDVPAACDSLKSGHALISMGLLVELSVNHAFEAGDLATNLGDTVHVTATVKCPSWIQADQLTLFINGRPVRKHTFPTSNGERLPGGVAALVQMDLARPAHDVFLTAIATGPAVTEPYWPMARPYQARSRFWSPRVMGVTNPVWLDADGDGRFTSARALAEMLVKEAERMPEEVISSLNGYDESVAVHAAALLEEAGVPLNSADILALMSEASEATRNGFSAYLASER